MFSYCYLGCLVYIGWYILGVCSVGVCGCVVCMVVVCWGGVWWCIIQQLLYYYIWYVVGWCVWCVYVLFTFISMYWYIVVVYGGGVYGVVCMCICYIYYILYYILCVYCICIVSIMLVVSQSLFVSVLVTIQTQLRDRLYPPQCYSPVRHNINTNKIKKLA